MSSSPLGCCGRAASHLAPGSLALGSRFSMRCGHWHGVSVCGAGGGGEGRLGPCNLASGGYGGFRVWAAHRQVRPTCGDEPIKRQNLAHTLLRADKRGQPSRTSLAGLCGWASGMGGRSRTHSALGSARFCTNEQHRYDQPPAAPSIPRYLAHIISTGAAAIKYNVHLSRAHPLDGMYGTRPGQIQTSRSNAPPILGKTSNN